MEKLKIPRTVSILLSLMMAQFSVAANYNCQCFCSYNPRKDFDRIVGGVKAQPNEHPFMVGIAADYICGGTLITRQHVLTAAHCIIKIMEGTKIPVAVVGSIQLHDRSHKVGIIGMVYHERYNNITNENDIGMLKLDRRLQFSPAVQPACLPSIRDSVYRKGTLATVIGFGLVAEQKDQLHPPWDENLKHVNVPIVSNPACAAVYGRKGFVINDRVICAGYKEGLKDSCQGDSGGPLTHFSPYNGVREVIGVVSYGFGCAQPGFPGVYMKVSSYLDWIRAKVGDECLCFNEFSNPEVWWIRYNDWLYRLQSIRSFYPFF